MRPVKLYWVEKMRELEPGIECVADFCHVWNELWEYGLSEEKRITEEYAGRKK